MIMVAIHAAATGLHDRGRVSLGEPTIAWNREDLVENEAAPEQECLDPAAARRLFPATQATQPERAAVRAAEGGRQPRAAPPKQSTSEAPTQDSGREPGG